MVQIAEKASLLNQEADKNFLIERANQLWDRLAIFDWDMADECSCNWSTTSDSDSSDAEGNGSRLNSLSWEGDVAKVSTEPDLLNTLQQSPYAQELYAYQSDQISNPSSTRHGFDGSLNAGPEASNYPYGQYPLVGATYKLQYAQTSLYGPTPSIYSVSEAGKQFDVSQRTPQGSLQSPVDDISYQNMERSSCLSCGAITMWPEASFCLNCILSYDPLEDLYDASSSAPLQGTKVSFSSSFFFKKLIFICQLSANAGTCHGQEPHDRSWMIEPCECFKPRSSHPYARDKMNMTDSSVRKRKNLLV